jgi:hypothetical protein
MNATCSYFNNEHRFNLFLLFPDILIRYVFKGFINFLHIMVLSCNNTPIMVKHYNLVSSMQVADCLNERDASTDINASSWEYETY